MALQYVFDLVGVARFAECCLGWELLVDMRRMHEGHGYYCLPRQTGLGFDVSLYFRKARVFTYRHIGMMMAHRLIPPSF
jgi:hypothetical protein